MNRSHAVCSQRTKESLRRRIAMMDEPEAAEPRKVDAVWPVVLASIPYMLLWIELLVALVFALFIVLLLMTCVFGFLAILLVYVALWLAVIFNGMGTMLSLVSFIVGYRNPTARLLAAIAFVPHAVLLAAVIYVFSRP